MTFQYFCPICNKSISNESNFIQHYRSHKPINFLYSRNLYPCKICGERLVPLNKTYCSNKCKHSDPELNIKRVRKEQNDRTKHSECNICGQVFNDTINASGHLSKHLKEVHDIHTKDYTQYFTLKDKPYKERLYCSLCNWSTADVHNKGGQLTNHLKNIHNTTITKLVEENPIHNHLLNLQCNYERRTNFINESVDNYVECGICNQKFKYLTSTHLALHNITPTEYKLKYGETHSKNTSEILAKNYLNGLGLYEGKYMSKAEIEITEYLKLIGVTNIQTTVRSIITPYELDIYVPDYKIAIEYNGLYHHSELGGDKSPNYHLNKTQECLKKDIRLIHIFEDEWTNKKDIVKTKLSHIFNKSLCKKIYGRQVSIKNVSAQDATNFINTFHIQGSKTISKIRYGAYFKDELVAIMTFSKSRNIYKKKENSNNIELVRYATDSKYHCIGVASKLLSHFVKNNEFETLLSYADVRWSNQFKNLYTEIGFNFIRISSPNYWYMKDYRTRQHRYNYNKHTIVNKLGGDKNKTEWGNMIELGFDRIWDCGNIRYEYIKPKNNE